MRLDRLKETLEGEKKILDDLMKVIESAHNGKEEKKATLSWFV